MSIFWPWETLKPQSIMVDISPRNLRGPSAQSGFTQVVSNSAGLWKVTFYNIPVYSASMIRLWRSISNYAEGQLNDIIIPVWDYPRAPIPNGVIYSDFFDNSIPHDSDAFFDDDEGYENTLISVDAAANASIGATSLSLTKNFSGDLEPGHRFSVNYKLYEIRTVESQTASTASITIRPPLREAIVSGDPIIFDYPTMKVRLASDNEMQLPLNFNQQSFQTVNFIESL